MHKISEKISLFVMGNSIPNDTSEMISYSIEAILTSIFTALSAFILCCILNCTSEFLLFIFCFIPLRMSHKSFHFKSFYQYFISSNLMIVFCSLLLKYSSNKIEYLFINYILILVLYFLSFEKNIFETIVITFIFTLSLCLNLEISKSIFLSILMNLILITRRIYNEKNIRND